MPANLLLELKGTVFLPNFRGAFAPRNPRKPGAFAPRNPSWNNPKTLSRLEIPRKTPFRRQGGAFAPRNPS